MKPRFSILMLLGVTAYAGLTAGAFTRPLSILPYIHFAVVVVMMMGAVVIACGRPSHSSVFCRGFVLLTILSFLFRFWKPNDVESVYCLNSLSWNLYELMVGPSRSRQLSDDEVTTALRLGTILTMNVQLAFGVLGGTLALWRFRVLERREKKAH